MLDDPLFPERPRSVANTRETWSRPHSWVVVWARRVHISLTMRAPRARSFTFWVEVDGQVMESAKVVYVDRLKATGLNTNLYCNVSSSTCSLVCTVTGDPKTAAAIGKAPLLVEERNNWK
jgi:hypothetical protein